MVVTVILCMQGLCASGVKHHAAGVPGCRLSICAIPAMVMLDVSQTNDADARCSVQSIVQHKHAD